MDWRGGEYLKLCKSQSSPGLYIGACLLSTDCILSDELVNQVCPHILLTQWHCDDSCRRVTISVVNCSTKFICGIFLMGVSRGARDLTEHPQRYSPNL